MKENNGKLWIDTNLIYVQNSLYNAGCVLAASSATETNRIWTLLMTTALTIKKSSFFTPEIFSNFFNNAHLQVFMF